MRYSLVHLNQLTNFVNFVQQYNKEDFERQQRLEYWKFAQEYVKDYDPFQAMVRIGRNVKYCADYCHKWLQEDYVIYCIRLEEERLGITTDEQRHKKYILGGLLSECKSGTMSVPGNGTGTSRVAAFTQFAKLMNMEPPTKAELKTVREGNNEDFAHLSLEEILEIKKKMYPKAS